MRLLPVLAAALSLAACDSYEIPNRPLPTSLEMETLDGELWGVSSLSGKPWVINLWVPG